MQTKLLTQALSVASRELSKHPEFDHKMHWTFIVQRNKIVEWATNRTHEPDKRYGYKPTAKLHSELLAYKRAVGLLTTDKFEVINIRLNRQGKPKISMPCETCYRWLRSTGCTKIYFTTEIGWSYVMA